jgi:orotate phosphoribosyltransferase
MVDLFQRGAFTLSSGEHSSLKIDCDALTVGDIRTLAWLAAEVADPFDSVEGVPHGGDRLAANLEPYIEIICNRLLIVDDVLTTGASMEKQRAGREAQGVVIFARGPCPDWVTPLFQMEISDV